MPREQKDNAEMKNNLSGEQKLMNPFKDRQCNILDIHDVQWSQE